jgi:hypothetical protein
MPLVHMTMPKCSMLYSFLEMTEVDIKLRFTSIWRRSQTKGGPGFLPDFSKGGPGFLPRMYRMYRIEQPRIDTD